MNASCCNSIEFYAFAALQHQLAYDLQRRGGELISESLRRESSFGVRFLAGRLETADLRDRLRAVIPLAAVAGDFGAILIGGWLGFSISSPVEDRSLGLSIALGVAFAMTAAVFRLYRTSLLAVSAKSTVYALSALAISEAALVTIAAAIGSGTDLLATGPLATGCVAAAGVATVRLGIGRTIAALGPHLNAQVLVLCDTRADTDPVRSGRCINIHQRNWKARPNDPQFLREVYEAVKPFDKVILDFSDAQEARDWSLVMRLTGIDAELVNSQLDGVAPIGIGRWHRYRTVIVSRGALTIRQRALKRAFDLAVVGLAAPILLPVIGLCSLAVKLETPGPAFFVQERVGRNNRRYRCYKLRSMRLEMSDADGRTSAGRSDARITKVGRFLRATSLDEAPQIFNVLLGEMSIVGPRPHALGSTAEGQLFWDVVDSYWARHAVKPGITGLAQTRGLRGATQTRADIIDRVRVDIEYISTWSIWLDISILLATLKVVIHRNAY